MELEKAFQYAMALLPAILCILVLVLPRLSKAARDAYNKYEAVKLAKEIVVHSSFYGPAVTVLFGYGNQPYAWVIVALWFVILTRLAYGLALRCKFLKNGETHA